MKMMGSAFGGNFLGTLSIVTTMFFEKNSYCNLYNEKYVKKIMNKMDHLVSDFLKALNQRTPSRPSYYDIYLFNGLKSKTYMSEADYYYWKERGWLEGDYYYDTKISIGKRLFGHSLNRMIKNGLEENATSIERSVLLKLADDVFADSLQAYS